MMHLLRRWRALWTPEMYHGWGYRRRFFEGWYFKMVAPAGAPSLAVIPGVSMSAAGDREAFIMVLHGTDCRSTHHTFPFEAFRPSPRAFSFRIGPNFFSGRRLELDLPGLRGRIEMQEPFPWPATLGAPGIMGWYSFVPLMECYHGVASMDHGLAGDLVLDGRYLSMDGGRGYIEKDWGRSFPSAWIWLQTNHFESGPGTSLMVSVARIPWLGSHFIGFIVGFLHRGRLYRFATYTGAEMRAEVEGDVVRLSFRDRRYRLDLLAHKGPHGELVSPIEGQMAGKVNESLQASVDAELWEGGERRFRGRGRHAGLELAGPVDILLTRDWRR